MFNFLREKWKKMDFILITAVLLLAIYGILCISSATRDEGMSKTIIQIAAVLLGIICMLILSLFNYENIADRMSILLYIFAILLLAVTLVIGTGEGNKSWIRFPGIPVGIQPSEFVKIIFIITFSKHLERVKDNINKIKNILLLCLHAGIIIGLVLLQGDLGTGLVFMCIFAFMMLSAGVSFWYFASAIMLIICAAPYIWSQLKDYQKMRILVGFQPELDPLDKGWQPILSKKAIANGGLWGTGYRNGTISMDTPANHTDMIFSQMAEEFGFLGAMVFFILIVLVLLRVLRSARRSRRLTGTYMCVGVASILFAQTLENIGMCLGMLPVIGITLPFMSYGGSSSLSLFMAIGLVLSVNNHRIKYYFEREDL